MWPFKDKNPVNEIKKEEPMDMGQIYIPQEKSFDWAHYQAIAHGGIHAAYQDEYEFTPTVRVLKSLFAREPWVNYCCNAIARQFFNSKHVLKLETSSDGNEQIIKQHPLLSFLEKAGAENPAFFVSNNILDLILTGNAFVWISPDLASKKRLPSERMDLKFTNGVLTSYQIINPTGDQWMQGGIPLTLYPNEVLHFKMPNPYTPWVGMSLLIATNLPVLIDKYGREFIIGFFLRGGQTTGIIQTDATNADQLTRFVKTVMQAIGGRRNAHADKVLPKGATWAGSGSKFNEIQLTDVLKDNQTLFRAATGTTNTVLGIAENVNRATAMAEMEHFWRMTILPLQYIYCSAIKHSSLWARFGLDDRYVLAFDNSHIEYLDNFSRKLDEDGKLKPVSSINERRLRLGFSSIERLGDLFEIEMTPPPAAPTMLGFAVPQEAVAEKGTQPIDEISVIKSELPKLQDPTNKIEGYFHREFARWEDITLANLKNLDKAKRIIKDRGEKFAEGYSNIVLPEAMRVYDFHINRLKKVKSFHKKDALTETDRNAKLDAIKDRGREILKGNILKDSKTRFYEYSEDNMQRIHTSISEQIEAGKNLEEVALFVRGEFDEFYTGQSKTIVRTEFASAMAAASYQFGSDLAKITKKLKKTWLTMEDSHVRKDHIDLDAQSKVGEADKVPEMYFELRGKNYLRYPKDSVGNPEDVINCRCDLIWDVIEWSE